MAQWQQTRARNAAAIMQAARANPIFRVPDIPNSVTHAWYKREDGPNFEGVFLSC